MRYDNPEMRELLAAEYLLGTMPRRARARFERLMRQDPGLATLVGDWAQRFSAIDRATPAEAPPARVWRRIEARIAPHSAAEAPVMAPPAQSLREALQFWRGLAVAASAVAAALIVYLAAVPGPVGPQTPRVIAVLADQGGEPEWIATAGPHSGEIAVAALRPQPEQSTVLSPKDLPAPGDVLAVSLEPVGGSPTGLPTGPVVSQGKIIRPL